jgi:hypothetical protein
MAVYTHGYWEAKSPFQRNASFIYSEHALDNHSEPPLINSCPRFEFRGTTMAQNKPTLLDLLSKRYSPIQGTITAHLGAAEVSRLSRTGKGFSDLVHLLQDTKYNINKHLERWFSDPKEFRTLQGKCNAYITGDSAFKFFTQGTLSMRLEIHVETKHFDALQSYFLREGYDIDDDDTEQQLVVFAKDKENPTPVIKLTYQKEPSLFPILVRM